jgi:hypothetical protein
VQSELASVCCLRSVAGVGGTLVSSEAAATGTEEE